MHRRSTYPPATGPRSADRHAARVVRGRVRRDRRARRDRQSCSRCRA